MSAKDLLFRGWTGLHRAIYRVSGGRLIRRGFGMPVVVLTTTGRKSGKRRETMLTTPLELGDSVVLVASFGGDDRHPAWFLNLREHPEVELERDGTKREMIARVTDGEERDDLWQRLTAAHGNYAGYQRKTDREIPVVVLDPA